MLKSTVRNPSKLLDRALLWLHELEVIRLNKGLAVFRPAMTIRLEQRDRRGFSKVDFEPLALHYTGQVLQINVMKEFAERGLAAMGEALRLAMDYFALTEEEFLARWLPGRDREIGRQTTPASWRAIVESLGNTLQQHIVADEREQTNVLVLAGPGSGKTRVLVHRIAWLIRVRRENARGILALAYNRHAAGDIRRRLAEMIGDDARGVTVLTCHALAMRLAGASFTGRSERPDDAMFRDVMGRAVALLRGEELSPEEADERRERLLAGFRWILVDEYQDVALEQYELISALAGRTLEDDAGKLTLFAVGDDDQNIYAFNGASVEFIRRFEADYGPRPTYLTANYRSTAHIVAAANAVIEPARDRMKAGHPIRVDRVRESDPPGGAWAELDPVSRGRVQTLPAGGDPVGQARAVMAELLRLGELAQEWHWSRCASSRGSGSTWFRCGRSARRMASPYRWRTKRSRTSGACGKPGRSSSGCADAKRGSSTARPCAGGRTRGPPIPGTTCCGRRWRNTRWKPAAERRRWTTSSSGWPSGAGTYAAASGDCCCSPPIARRAWSSITWRSWTAAGTAWAATRTRTRRAGCTMWR